MIDAATFNAPNWVDLSTPDVATAAAFYGELFTWDIFLTSTSMGDYYVGKVGADEVAGMMEQSPEAAGAPPMWTVFFSVAHIDKSMELVESAAGTVLTRPFDIPGGAKVGVVSDPTGAMLALICGGETPAGVFLSAKPGTVCWVELMSRNPDAALSFYREVFGWEHVVDTSSGVPYTVFKLDGVDVAGMIPMPDVVPVEAPSHWAVYFAVRDCDEICRTACELGGTVLVPVMDFPAGRFAVLADPQGASFDVMELAAHPS